MWLFRGTPHYLDAQGARLGLTRILTDRARRNAEIHRIATLLGQLNERWRQLRKGTDGRPVVFLAELEQVKGTLAQAQEESAKLHALAASAQAMIDEAYRAFGIEPPESFFRVRCDFDEIASPADLAPVKLNHSRKTTKAE
jgi:hypothetical protein